MGIKITRDGNIIKASGWPARSIVGFVFGILFLIVGVLIIFANTTLSLVIIVLSNIILYASRRHGNGARNRKLAEEVEKDRQRNLTEMEEKTRLENKRNFSDGHDTKYGITEQIDPGAMVEGCIQQLKNENRIPEDFRLSNEARQYIKDVAAASLFDKHLSMQESGSTIINFIIGYRFHQRERKLDEELEDAEMDLANDEKKLADLEREKQQREEEKRKSSEKQEKEMTDQEKIDEYRKKGDDNRNGKI